VGEHIVKKNRVELVSAAKAVGAILAIAFVVDIAAAAALVASGFMECSPTTVLLDATLLAVITAPPIYWLVLQPIHREYRKRLEAERQARDLGQLAITDPLTRLMNRRGITMALLEGMAQAERYNTPLTVAMADIDHFKKVNDAYGHDAGDEVLASVAGVLSETVRMPDKVGRYGGEEFLVVLPHTTLAQGRTIAERICKAVGTRTFRYQAAELPLTLSLGATQFRKGEDLEQLLSRVDKALYDAKRSGRNRVAVRKAVTRAARPG
jgi:diguanylate cyclase (GGDEF)-like protein